jgi:hypothetical protein
LRSSCSEATGERRATTRRALGFLGSGTLVLSGCLMIGAVMSGCGSKLPSSSTTQTTPAPTTTATPLPVTSTTNQANIGLGSYLPLWPFATSEEVQAWEQSNSSGGHQPWHLDAGITALAFVNGYLGFTEIDTVIHTNIDASGAHVAIGFVTAGTSTSTATVIHMVRWGTSPGSPWEVVGTDDTTLALTTPAYGSTVTSPATVGGTITGVDEQLVVTVHQSASSAPLGVSAGVPAGGVNAPWSTTVSYRGATEPVLAFVVQTGGHIRTVERFAITGVRNG